MAADPGPDFRWGLVLRRSKYDERIDEHGNVVKEELSTQRQEFELSDYISRHKLGRVTAVYCDIASGYKEKAKRPEFEAALFDLSNRIDGIAAWRPDRLVRRVSQFRHVLTTLERTGGRLLFLKPILIDTADASNRAFTSLFLDLLVAFAEMESEATAERVTSWHQHRARAGLAQRSCMRPFGRTDDWLGLVDAEVKLLNEAVERILEGEGFYKVTTTGTSVRFPPPRARDAGTTRPCGPSFARPC